MLARKVDGYVVHAEQQEKPARSSTAPVKAVPVLTHIQSFLLALMNPSDEGRFFYSVNPGEHKVELRYMLLDPTHHFREIVDEARAVVLAGGTMSPVSRFPLLLPSQVSRL